MHGSALEAMDSVPSSTKAEGYPGKRAFDVVGGCVLIVLTTPVRLLIYCAVKSSSAGPVIFRQTRIGQDGKPFVIEKFRTLRVGSGKPHDTVLKGDPRLISLTICGMRVPLGWWLRETHLDELPQLFNVRRGEMSLVGPRPDTPENTAKRLAKNPRHWELLKHRPGAASCVCLKGKWEELERNDPSFDATDEELKYFENESLLKNLRLLELVAWGVSKKIFGRN